MKLDRNVNPNGKGKYALIKLRHAIVESFDSNSARVLPASAIDFGDTPDTDFFVLRLKDKFAAPALFAYAESAKEHDVEYAAEIMELGFRAQHHANKQLPT